MIFRLIIFALLTLCFEAQTQMVHIPDPALRASIRESLALPETQPITRADMLKLKVVGYKNRGIKDITGLEHATNLESLGVYVNEVIDIRPLAGLTKLTYLTLRKNKIVDVSPLANLTNLKDLLLQDNQIVDASPLAHLRQLRYLDIRWNPVLDYSALDSLSLDTFLFDETCDSPGFPVDERINNRNYPSIFAAWGGPGWIRTLNRPELSDIENLASHDLWWSSPRFGLRFKHTSNGIQLVGDIDDSIRRRDEYLRYNPNMLFLVEIRMLTFPTGWYPADWPHWIAYDTEISRNIVDFTHPDVQQIIVDYALAVANCGLFDGVFIDHWHEDSHYLNGHGPSLEDELGARDNILRRIRAHARPEFLIMVNTNRRKALVSASYINGLFLESGVPSGFSPSDYLSDIEIEARLGELEDTLPWADEALRAPQINGVEGWGFPEEPLDSPKNLRWMRAMTTFSLTFSDGYILYNDGESHRHYWYDFWDADLGRPVGEKGQLYQDIEGLYIREFTNGWAVYNHSGAAQPITLGEKVQGVASGWVGTQHALPNLDGEMYLRVKPANPADVNGDGVVNIFDLTIVAQAFGTDGAQGDVNGDGVVNVFDLVLVANQF